MIDSTGMLICRLPARRAPRFRTLAAGVLFYLSMHLDPVFAQGTPSPVSEAPPGSAPRTIVFFGDSITRGYGRANSDAEAFPALIARKLTAAGLPYSVVNAGVSGDTTGGGLRRIDWVLQRPVDILFLELGGNDGLRGLPAEEIARNLQAIIDKTRAKNPGVRVVIAGMRMPPNLGADYVARFQAIFPTLARQNPGVTLLPFILEGVGGRVELNQADRIHPTAQGHRIIADLVWATLEPLCRAR